MVYEYQAGEKIRNRGLLHFAHFFVNPPVGGCATRAEYNSYTLLRCSPPAGELELHQSEEVLKYPYDGKNIGS